jgi:K(+)-stimulated pyrophosphate-energized sodium pump
MGEFFSNLSEQLFNEANKEFSTWVLVAAVFPVIALVFALILRIKINSFTTGDETMVKIYKAIRKGAGAFLRTEYMILILFVIILGGVLLYFIDWPKHIASLKLGEGAEEPAFDLMTAFGNGTTLCFLVGAFASAFAGFIGMRTATAANVRTTAAAQNSLGEAFRIAFSSGTVMGMSVVGLGLLGLTAMLLWAIGAEGIGGAPGKIFGFSLGASSIALFARVGGGIFTKAADVGADLVGKVEAGIPEDDPRNPAAIADSVGDNVGDVAGMGADLFESYVGSIIASMALGALTLVGLDPEAMGKMGRFGGYALVFLPLGYSALGILASVIGTFVVRTEDESKLHAALFRGLLVASLIFAGLAFGLTHLLGLFNNPELAKELGAEFTGQGGILWAVLSGLILGLIIGKVTEYYTSEHKSPVQTIAKQSETGAATNIIHGLAVGMQSTAIPVLLIGAAIWGAYYFAGIYGVGISAVGMLSTLGISLGVDAYGPVADNAGGIAEMSHCAPEVRTRTDALDAVGNTTAAIGKGFAIGSAALTALALFTTYKVALQAEAVRIGNLDYENLVLDILDPTVTVGLLVGGILPFLFSALAMTAVGSAANKMINEVRRQFRTIPGIMEGTGEPQYGRCVAIATRGALAKMILPGFVAIAAPISMGLLLGPKGLGGLLAGALVTGVLMAIFQSNAGGAWDNAKKYIEKGNLGGKGSDPHKAAVVGDTVGDPFKDTSGPSINILIKLMSIVSLVFIPLFL